MIDRKARAISFNKGIRAGMADESGSVDIVEVLALLATVIGYFADDESDIDEIEEIVTELFPNIFGK